MIKYLVPVLLVALCTVPIYAQKDKESNDPEATKLLNKVRTKYDAYKSMEAVFSLAIEVPSQKSSVQKGTLAQDGAKFRLDMPDQVIVCDGKSNWIYLAGNNEVQINDVDPNDESSLLTPKELLRRYQKGDYLYALTDVVKEKGKLLSQVEFKPIDRDSEYSKIRVSIDKGTNEIASIKAFAKDGSRYTFTVSSFSPNKKFGAKHFVMDTSKYKGVHIEDLRF